MSFTWYIVIQFIRVNGEKKPCEKTDLQGEFPMMWAWLKQATHSGDVAINGHMVSMWNYTVYMS